MTCVCWLILLSPPLLLPGRAATVPTWLHLQDFDCQPPESSRLADIRGFLLCLDWNYPWRAWGKSAQWRFYCRSPGHLECGCSVATERRWDGTALLGAGADLWIWLNLIFPAERPAGGFIWHIQAPCSHYNTRLHRGPPECWWVLFWEISYH